MQNDFFTGSLKNKRAINITEQLQRLAIAARKNTVPIIYSIDAHYSQDVEIVRKWGNHAIKGTEETKVIPELMQKKIKTTLLKSGLTADSMRQAWTRCFGASTKKKA